MKRKYLLYGIMPMFLLGLAGVGTASAQGWFARNANIDPVMAAGDQEDRFAQEAAVLGISIEQVKDYWAQGKSPRDIIDELNLDETAIHERMLAERQANQVQRQTNMKNHIQSLVDQGVITQAQADKRLEFIANNEGKFKSGEGNKMERGHGMRGMGFGLAQ